jgi:hypothetical protein
MMGRHARRFIPVLGFWQLSVIYKVNGFLNSPDPEKPMTRDEHLVFCKVCINRAFDPQLGIVCSLTRQHASFDRILNLNRMRLLLRLLAITHMNTGALSKLMFRRPWLLPGNAWPITLLTEL